MSLEYVNQFGVLNVRKGIYIRFDNSESTPAASELRLIKVEPGNENDANISKVRTRNFQMILDAIRDDRIYIDDQVKGFDKPRIPLNTLYFPSGIYEFSPNETYDCEMFVSSVKPSLENIASLPFNEAAYVRYENQLYYLNKKYYEYKDDQDNGKVKYIVLCNLINNISSKALECIDKKFKVDELSGRKVKLEDADLEFIREITDHFHDGARKSIGIECPNLTITGDQWKRLQNIPVIGTSFAFDTGFALKDREKKPWQIDYIYETYKDDQKEYRINCDEEKNNILEKEIDRRIAATNQGCITVSVIGVKIRNIGVFQSMLKDETKKGEKYPFAYPPAIWIKRGANSCMINNVHLAMSFIGIRSDAGRTYLSNLSGQPIYRGIHLNRGGTASDVNYINNIHFWRFDDNQYAVFRQLFGNVLYIEGTENSFFDRIFAIGYHVGFNFRNDQAPKFHISNIDFDTVTNGLFVHHDCKTVYGQVVNFSCRHEEKDNLQCKPSAMITIPRLQGDLKCVFHFSNITLAHPNGSGIRISGEHNTVFISNIEISQWNQGNWEDHDANKNATGQTRNNQYAVFVSDNAKLFISNYKIDEYKKPNGYEYAFNKNRGLIRGPEFKDLPQSKSASSFFAGSRPERRNDNAQSTADKEIDIQVSARAKL